MAIPSSSSESAVSWGAVIAGAVGAAALSLILIMLGTGIGLSVVSPWANDGASAKALAASTIVWITIVQGLASVLGGYLAGRLRTRWVTVHTNEVFFRDTAHGFLAWAVATLLMASLLSSAIASSLSTGVKAAGAAAGTATAGDYYVDKVLRAPRSDAPDREGEVGRVFARSLASGELSPADSQYLSQLVASRANVSQAEAERRVNETFTEARQAADDARKASALTALWLVVSLLSGAFLASFAATFGGRLRDSAVLTTS